MSVVFGEIPSGQWLRGRDYVGHRVLFVTKRIETREGTYGTELVATVDFADLDGDKELIEECKISDQHITSKLREGVIIVGKIDRAVPKQKGYQGAIFLANLDDSAKAIAQKDATEILNGGMKKQVDNIEQLFKQ